MKIYIFILVLLYWQAIDFSKATNVETNASKGSMIQSINILIFF